MGATLYRLITGVPPLNAVERADRSRVLNDVRSAVDEIRPDLPDGAEEPEIRERRPILPVISIVVYGEQDEDRIREAAQRVRDDLEDLTESAEVTIAGIRDREIWIEIQPALLDPDVFQNDVRRAGSRNGQSQVTGSEQQTARAGRQLQLERVECGVDIVQHDE